MKHVIVIVLSLSIFSMINAQSCNNFWTEVSSDGQYLYYTSDKAGEGYEIYRMTIDGEDDTKLTDSPDPIFYPAVSSDGSKITYQTNSYGSTAEVYIMDSDGSNVTQLTDNSIHDGYPNFSPDGQTIVFEAWDSSAYPEIFTMNIDGSSRTQLTNQGGAFWQSAPKFNPAGDKIYFSAGFNADNHYEMMDLDGSNWVEITPPNSFGYSEWALEFNADGSKIIFLSTEWKGYNNGGDLVMADSDGSNWQRLTEAADNEYFYQANFHPNEEDLFLSYYNPNQDPNWHIMRFDIAEATQYEFIDCTVTGLEDLEAENELNLYPNPAKDRLTVELSENHHGKTLIEIYDVQGRSVWSEEIDSSRELLTIDTRKWRRGVYLLKVKAGQLTSTKQFVLSD